MRGDPACHLLLEMDTVARLRLRIPNPKGGFKCNTEFFLHERRRAGRPDGEEREGPREPAQLEAIKPGPEGRGQVTVCGC